METVICYALYDVGHQCSAQFGLHLALAYRYGRICGRLKMPEWSEP
jgi:hypothetical protein